MTWERKTVIIESIIIVLLIGTCIGIYKYFINPKLVFEWKGKTTETIYVDNFSAEYCQRSAVWIDGKQNGKDFLVTAGDECKKASRLLTVKTDIKHHTPLIMYGPTYDVNTKKFNHSFDAMYFYSFGFISIGGGLSATFAESQLLNIGPKVGLQIRL